MFSLKNVEKPLVLPYVHFKMLKNQWFHCGVAEKC